MPLLTNMSQLDGAVTVTCLAERKGRSTMTASLSTISWCADVANVESLTSTIEWASCGSSQYIESVGEMQYEPKHGVCNLDKHAEQVGPGAVKEVIHGISIAMCPGHG